MTSVTHMLTTRVPATVAHEISRKAREKGQTVAEYLAEAVTTHVQEETTIGAIKTQIHSHKVAMKDCERIMKNKAHELKVLCDGIIEDVDANDFNQVALVFFHAKQELEAISEHYEKARSAWMSHDASVRNAERVLRS